MSTTKHLLKLLLSAKLISQEEYEKICELIKKQFLQNKVTTVIATTSPSVAKDLTKRTIKFKLGSITE